MEQLEELGGVAGYNLVAVASAVLWRFFACISCSRSYDAGRTHSPNTFIGTAHRLSHMFSFSRNSSMISIVCGARDNASVSCRVSCAAPSPSMTLVQLIPVPPG